MRFQKTIIATIGSLLLLGTLGHTQAPPASPAPKVAAQSTPSAAPPLTRENLETWLDGYLPFALKSNDMAGAIVVVVKDGKVLLNKGYGYNDVANKKPIDPDRTMFRAASVSKTFTGTAVMQLVEQGKLDLDRDVNAYLDFTLPKNRGQAVTLRHLLTHTAGFDDLQKGSTPIDPKWHMSLEAYMKRRVPNYPYPVGTMPAYSNFGIALAGYAVQRVSGELFEDYLERHIFQPLGLKYTTCRQPIPMPLRKYKANAYILGSGEPQPFELGNTAPAGCISIAGADMARYMIMHLQNGQYENTRILKPETARLMHARTFSPVPHVNGMAIGFFEGNRNGRRIIGHDGDSKGVHADMKLLLDDNVGWFVGYNANGKNDAVYELRQRLFEDFSDRYFPAPIPNEKTVSTARQHSQMAAGNYGFSRLLNGVLSVYMMFNTATVTANDDGTISIPQPPTNELKTYHEIAPFLWREIGGKELLAMKVTNGQVTLHNDPANVFIKIPAWRALGFNLPPLLASILVLFATIIIWPAAALIRRYHGRPSPLAGADARWHRWARIAAAMFVAFIAGWFYLTANLLSHFYWFNAGLDPWLRLLHLFGILGVLGTAAVAIDMWRAWKSRRAWPSRLWSLVLLLACLWMIWFSFAFNLITWSLDY